MRAASVAEIDSKHACVVLGTLHGVAHEMPAKSATVTRNMHSLGKAGDVGR